MPRVAQSRSVPPACRGIPLALLWLTAMTVTAGPAARPATGAEGTDSVLAVVRGRSAATPVRAITRAQFTRAWSQLSPPVRPDSLTPAGARRFLDLLIDKEALGLMAAGEPWTWTDRERAGLDALRDQLVVGAVLDSALAATRDAMGPAADTLDRQALGIAARDRAVAGLGMVWDDSLLVRLARAFAALKRPTADSSVAAQLRMLGASPVVDPSDTGRVVARSSAGDYRVGDLLDAWRRLSPIYRPRVETPDQVRDLVTNGLYERSLRRSGAERDLERRGDIAARLAAERERLAVSHLVAREVYARVPADSLTLLRRYRAHLSDWAVPPRVRLLRLALSDRRAAGEMAVRLRRESEAESLAAQSRRAGTGWLRDVSAREDSALFARAVRAGSGTVLGPTEAEGGWEVTRVVALLPGRDRPFEEVRDLVRERWYAEEGERRMQELIARARGAARVEVRERALAALVRDPP